MAQKIAKNSDARFPIVVTIVDSDLPNGFTLPGGRLYINRGLILRSQTEAQLAAALSHGIARVALRPGAKLGEGDLLLLDCQSLWAPVDYWGDMFQQLNPPSVPCATLLKQHREYVHLADYLALQYLYHSGYDPTEFSDFLQLTSRTPPVFRALVGSKSAKRPHSGPPGPSPTVSERLAAMRKEINAILPPRNTDVVSTSDFQSFRDRLVSLSLAHTSAQTRPSLRLPAHIFY